MTNKVAIEREALLPCPFCGDDGDKGRQEVTQMIEGRNKFARITCRACGAMCPEENWNRRAALAQKAEPDEQEVALQKIADFGQDQVMTPDVLISKLANLRCMATERHVPEVDLATIDLAIEHLRYFSVTLSHRAPSHRLSDARMDGIYNAWRDMGDDVSYGDLMRMVEAEIQGGK